jgi:hypothetical protein
MAKKILKEVNPRINAFMKHFGIIPESPGLNPDTPVLKYLVVAVNTGSELKVEKGSLVLGMMTLNVR